MKKMTLVMAAGIGLAMAGSVSAQLISWTNTGGGLFQTPENWDPNSVPGAANVAAFNTPDVNYTVTLNAPVTVNRIWIQPLGDLNFTLDLNGNTLTGTNTDNAFSNNVAWAGRTHNVIVMSSAPGAVLSVPRLRVSNATATSTNNFTLSGSNLMVNLTGSADNIFNHAGNGLIVFSDGVKVTSTWALQFAAGGQTTHPNTTWILTDPGTVVTNSRPSTALIVGKSGTNMPTMIISNGAAFYASAAQTTQVGSGGDSTSSWATNANGRMIITGVGSHFTTTTFMVSQSAGNAQLTQAGYAGTGGGFVTVEKGATVGFNALNLAGGHRSFDNLTVLVTNHWAYGEMIIRDTGSVVTATGSQQIGRGSQGAIYVLNGGQYQVADGANIEMARSWSSANLVVAGVTNATFHTNVNAYALMVVSNPGSYVKARAVFVGGDAMAGDDPQYGYGDVIVADNAHLKTVNTSAGITLRPRSSLTVSDALVESQTLIMASNTTLRIELGVREHLAANHYTNAYINLTGALNLTGTVNLELAFLDDFDTSGLTIGSEISLITMASQTGFFNGWASGVTTVSHGGYDFLYNEYSDEIYLSVIPEPGTLGLIAAGLGLAAILRRRR
ncbi:MAG: PEP-CTERM sorting domain-containing protein [Kiritimatiellia bacterium]|nr:PEP-CTERM sorting domain-containing protein [Kiritimatiellia bacterium]